MTVTLNIARNYLVNRDGPGFDADSPFAELVDPDFVAATPTPGIREVRRALFGDDPDGLMLDYRSRQLLATVHAGETRGLIAGLGGGISYLPWRNLTDTDDFFGPRIEHGDATPQFSGQPLPPDETGRTTYAFALTTDGTQATLRRIEGGPPRTWTLPLVFTGGLSDAQPLPGTGYNVLIPAGAGAWDIRVRLRPVYSLGRLEGRLARVGEPSLIELFGGGTREPYASLQRLWRDGTDTPDRVAAVTTALILHAHERNGGRLG